MTPADGLLPIVCLSGVAVARQRCRASGRGSVPGLASGDNPGQQLYHARAEQLGELGLPGCDEALSGMGGASLTNEVPGIMLRRFSSEIGYATLPLFPKCEHPVPRSAGEYITPGLGQNKTTLQHSRKQIFEC